MLAESALCVMGVLPVEMVMFRWPTFFQIPPQLWRLVTPFFLTGGGLNLLLDIYFSE
jgi:Derlin-2/3